MLIRSCLTLDKAKKEFINAQQLIFDELWSYFSPFFIKKHSKQLKRRRFFS